MDLLDERPELDLYDTGLAHPYAVGGARAGEDRADGQRAPQHDQPRLRDLRDGGALGALARRPRGRRRRRARQHRDVRLGDPRRGHRRPRDPRQAGLGRSERCHRRGLRPDGRQPPGANAAQHRHHRSGQARRRPARACASAAMSRSPRACAPAIIAAMSCAVATRSNITENWRTPPEEHDLRWTWGPPPSRLCRRPERAVRRLKPATARPPPATWVGGRRPPGLPGSD